MNQNKLREAFSYNETTGELLWRKSGTGRKPSREAGGLKKDGYRTVYFSGKRYMAHRIIWFYVYERWPNNQVDHINGDPSDNRLCNLREASNRRNHQNRVKHRDGKLPGCTYHKLAKKWQAQAYTKGKEIYIGLFKTEAEASKAYFQFCKLNQVD